MVRLCRVLFITSEAIGAVVTECNCLLDNFLEGFFEHSLGNTPATDWTILLDSNCSWLDSIYYWFYLFNGLCSSM